MNNPNKHIVPAFTIFEVTVVLAIMSVLISIIAVTTNRFNEQLHYSNQLSQEQNHFRMVRSTLWKDCINADSVIFNENTISIWNTNRLVMYKSIEDRLHKNMQGKWIDLQMNVESIYQDGSPELPVIHIDFLWKGEIMNWEFLNKPDLATGINLFFNHLNE